mmetsp:Transcript_21567/g.37028  ORF Transcript_21567/g.37028 Transcript_21567/m.37028 type:complete len:212 (+) Transcript_21567:667-1302(+)
MTGPVISSEIIRKSSIMGSTEPSAATPLKEASSCCSTSAGVTFGSSGFVSTSSGFVSMLAWADARCPLRGVFAGLAAALVEPAEGFSSGFFFGRPRRRAGEATAASGGAAAAASVGAAAAAAESSAAGSFVSEPGWASNLLALLARSDDFGVGTVFGVACPSDFLGRPRALGVTEVDLRSFGLAATGFLPRAEAPVEVDALPVDLREGALS